jgi:hypothetical protein
MLFLVVVAILLLLVGGMVILAMGSPGGSEGLGMLVRTVVGAGVLALLVRLGRDAFRR